MSNGLSKQSHLFRGITDIGKIIHVITKDGVLRAPGMLLKALRWRYLHMMGVRFDRKYNVQTEEWAQLWDLTVVDGERESGEGYEPMFVPLFSFLMSPLPSDLRDFVFVDFGSGKGRAVLLASNYPFKKIIGVEFAQELHATMQDNIQRYHSRKQRCVDIHAVCMDATKFEIPDEKCVLFFYNPFKKDTLEKVAKNIENSYRRNPRKIYILFYAVDIVNHVREIFDNIAVFKQKPRPVLDPRFLLLSPHDLAVYESPSF